ncbi:MAG: flagellar filament capping protein FliD [Lachnospiraceae bacterium]|nr:flagellar filament capping protein FliD [Lachnospiraceae bacterium]
MADTSLINAVYNNYLTVYSPRNAVSKPNKTQSNKSDARGIYNSIVKLNKESPLYILDTSKEAQNFAINIKEGARNFHNTVASLGGMEDDSLLHNKVAYSSDNASVNAKYIGSSTHSEDVPSYEVEIQSLAQPQTNLGYYLPADGHALKPNTYSFDIAINDLNYEFQYTVSEGDTNKDIQERLARLVTNANIGLKANVLDDGTGNSALQLQSNSIGLSDGKDFIFNVSDDKTSKTAGSIKAFGIGDITTAASNAQFTVNGHEHTTLSNHFTLEKKYELELLAPTAEDSPVTIGLKNDTESLTENLNLLIGSYNNFLKSAAEYIESQPNSKRLLHEMKSVASFHSNSLEPLGLSLQSDGSIALDDSLLSQTVADDNISELYSSVKDFTTSMLRKTTQVSINPMDYVNRKIVAYKNPGHNYANPYITSAYTGMMFNSYC